MIEWKKYDPENPPALYKTYLIYNYVEVRQALLDKPPLSDKPIFLMHLGATARDVVYYAM